MQALFEQYSADLPITARKPLLSNEAAKVVLLTGSTSSFGTYLLDSLLRDDFVAEIICLNTQVNASEPQVRALTLKCLSANFDQKPVAFADCQFSLPHLGLKIEEYEDFLQRTTHIIHNAWDVDFSLPRRSFEKHIQGVRRLVDLSARSRYGAAIYFVSSLGAVRGYNSSSRTDGEPIPESPNGDWTATSHKCGSDQAKLFAERLLSAATAQVGIPTTIFRYAQIAGPSSGDGEWNKNGFVPSLLVSSKNMGCLPSSLGAFENIDWIPIDLAARILLDILHQPSPNPEPKESRIYHVANPRPTTWQTLLPAVQSALAVKKTVPLAEWIDILEGLRERDVDQYPAVKFAAFYRTSLVEGEQEPRAVTLNTTESQKASETLATLMPITGGMLRRWIRKWF